MYLKNIFYDWLSYNKLIFKLINGFFSNPSALKFFGMVSFYLGNDDKIFIHLTLILSTIIIFSIFGDDKKNRQIKCLKVVLILFPSVFITDFFISEIKNLFIYLRPYCSDDINIAATIKAVYPLNTNECYKSFPSGHSAHVCSMILSLFPIMNRQAKILGIAIILAVGLSRIALARHFPADVLCGYLIAFLAVFTVRSIYEIPYNTVFVKTLFQKISR